MAQSSDRAVQSGLARPGRQHRVRACRAQRGARRHPLGLHHAERPGRRAAGCCRRLLARTGIPTLRWRQSRRWVPYFTPSRCRPLAGIHCSRTSISLMREPSLIGVGGVKLFLMPAALPAGHSLLFAVGAWPPHDGVRRARRLNLSRDLQSGVACGSGLSTRSPRPSSPRERRWLRLRQAETGTPLVMQSLPARRSACPSGTRCRRPTCDVGSPPACEPPRPVRVPHPGAWRRSCPRPAMSTIW
jgi:hypothetical protein